MKWLLILCLATLAAATYPPPKSSGTACSQRNDVNWVRQNAENLLYLEYLRQQAGSEDAGWKSQVSTDEYQTRLDELRTINTGCDSSVTVDESFESSSCSQSCGSTCSQGCENYGSRLVVFQAELKRQRLMIQRLYAQILTISQSSTCESKKYC